MQHSSCLQCLSIASTSTGWVPLDPTVATEKTQDCRTMDVPQLGVPYFSPYSHCLGSCLPLLGPSIVLIYITHKPLFVSRSLSRLPTAVLLFFFLSCLGILICLNYYYMPNPIMPRWCHGIRHALGYSFSQHEALVVVVCLISARSQFMPSSLSSAILTLIL